MNSFSGVLAGEELLGLVVEVVELPLQDRDDVTGNVLADLGVLERPLAAMSGRGLHREQGITQSAESRSLLIPLSPMSWNRPEEVLREVAERFGEDRLALAASWQKESSVLVDLIQKVAPGARIFTLDTGALFEETYATWRAIEERYGITGRGLPRRVDPRAVGLRSRPLLLPAQGRAARARARRTPTAGSPACAATSPPSRADTEEIGWDERRGLWKANPLASWSDADVWQYITEHDLPYNVLHEQGYASIGCTHCTVPSESREGRWAGLEKTECGLHA